MKPKQTKMKGSVNRIAGLCFACYLIALAGCGTGLEKEDHALEIDQLMQAYHEYGQFNGTLLVAENGQVIFKKGYGFANMEWEIPNSPDVKMRLGSVTKQFTSMLIMQLVQEGEIDLQAPVTEYLKDYREETGDRVTVHHLLTHTSGIPSYTSLPGFFREISRDPYPVDEFIEKYCSGDLEFDPGTRFRYSNSGYYLLGAIIEEVTGISYEKALQKMILKPLGMNDSGYDRYGTIISRRADGYISSYKGYENAPYLDMKLPFSAGAMYSTVEDLYLWDRALYKTDLLSEEYKQKMFTPFLSGYACGWRIYKHPVGDTGDSLRIIGHGGGINGFNTLLSRIVDDEHLIVLLNNTGGTNLDEMSSRIVRILYGEPYDMPVRSIGKVLYRELEDAGKGSAIEKYRELKENSADQYDFGEGELNRLGYILLNEGRLEEAIAVFRLNVESYPESSSAYDSLGEAYMKAGRRDEAIENYEKSLELDPDNAGAKRMLEKLK